MRVAPVSQIVYTWVGEDLSFVRMDGARSEFPCVTIRIRLRLGEFLGICLCLVKKSNKNVVSDADLEVLIGNYIPNEQVISLLQKFCLTHVQRPIGGSRFT